MSKNDIASRLEALATDNQKRTETARLREVFDSVEATLGAGVSQAAVLDALHAEGFAMTLASFKSALQRIRRERGVSAPRKRSGRDGVDCTIQNTTPTLALNAAPAEAPKKEAQRQSESLPPASRAAADRYAPEIENAALPPRRRAPFEHPADASKREDLI